MPKQTSIEWLIDQMFKQSYFDGNKPLSITNLDHLQQEAKQMHKEEIVNAWNDGDYAYFYSKETGRDFEDGNEYYQETYGGNHIVDTNKMVEAEEKPMRYHCVPKEISDEEIEEASRQINYGGGSMGWIKDAFKQGAKWYREQLKGGNNES